MDQLAPKCVTARKEYEECFRQWYSGAWLRGKDGGGKENCDDQFEAYQSCVLLAVKARNLGGARAKREEGAAATKGGANADGAKAKGKGQDGDGAAKA